MENKIENNNVVNIFDKPKIMDATGKELTREELIEFMKMRKQALEKQRNYIEENPMNEMFKDIPRHR